MKALTIRKYGSPKHLKFIETEIPSPAENEVLLKIKAASINSADIEWMKDSFCCVYQAL